MTPAALRKDADDVRQANRVATFTGVMMFWAVVFIPIYVYFGGPECAFVLLASCFVAMANLVALRRGFSTRFCGNVLCGVAFYVYSGLAVLNGGRWAPSTIWYVSLPVLSLVVCGVRWAAFWSAASVSAIACLSAAYYAGVQFPCALNAAELIVMHDLGLISLVLCFFLLAFMMARFENYSREILSEANRWLQVESSSDSLTKIANRRYFDDVFEQEWKRHRREQMPLTVVLIDLDYFKEFNDFRGHLAGDNVLRLIAGAIQSGVRRRDDVVARFGGEEFVVILPNTTDRAVQEVTDCIRDQVSLLGIQHPHSPVSPNVTISVGTATAIPTDECAHFDLLRQADEALYRAKAEGRDRVVHAAAPLPMWRVAEFATQFVEAATEADFGGRSTATTHPEAEGGERLIETS